MIRFTFLLATLSALGACAGPQRETIGYITGPELSFPDYIRSVGKTAD